MILSAIDILIVIAICILFGLILFFLYKSIKKEETKFHSEHIKGLESIIDKNQLVHDMGEYINRNGTLNRFYLMKIKIVELKSVSRNFKNKVTNDILINFVKQIKKTMKSAVICRESFDTFYIWYKDYLDMEQMRIIIDDLIYNLDIPLEFANNQNLNLELNYKIAVVAFPMHAKTLNETLENINLTFFSLLKIEENFLMFNTNIKEEETDNLRISKELKEGIKNNEFEFYFQPIYDVQNNNIKYAECLLRWNHPELGTLTPDKFFNVFENSGDISWLTYWGIEELFKRSNEITRKIGKSIILNLNLSQIQLKSEDLALNISRLVKKYKVDCNMFCFEIVEFALFQKYDLVFENIKKLRDLGFRIAIDDLGLEYHTLSKLENLPIDIIKLDNKFIEETKNNFMNTKIAEMLVEYSKDHRLDIIAEGIENMDMIKYITDIGINFIQGFFISKPLIYKDLVVFLNESTFKLISKDE